MHKAPLFSLLPALCLCLSGCSSVSVYQSAKTLPKGMVQAGLGLGAGKAGDKKRIPGFHADLPSVSGDIWARRGFTDRVDAGLKLSAFGSLTADSRYGLLNEARGDKWSLAAGLSFVYTDISTGSGADKDTTEIRDLLVPVYISKDLAPWFTVYGTPRYGRRTTKNTKKTASSSVSETLNSDMLGLGGGLMFNLGKDARSHLSFEFQKLADLSDSSHYVQNAGFAFSSEF